MINRQQPPETFDIEKFLLQKPQNEQLSNGVSVFQFINPLLDLIHFKIQINAGSVNESKKLVSSSCFNLLKESHPVKTGSEMDEILDFYGASWSVSTNMTNVSIQWIIPKSNCASLIPILMEIILNPTFKKDPFDRYQQRKIKDLEYKKKQIEDDFSNGKVADADMIAKGVELQKIIESLAEKEERWFELSSKLEE